MKLLIAPLHYISNNRDGSEYSRSYEYLHELAKDGSFSGDVLVGFSDEKKVGNFTIHTLWNKKPVFITIAKKIQFLCWVWWRGSRLLNKSNYDCVWHLGPFAIGETANLLSLTGKTPRFVIGPIYTPLSKSKTADSGYFQKDSQNKFTKLSPKYAFDLWLYRLSAKIFYPLSVKTLKRASHIVTIEPKGKEIIESMGITHVSVNPLTVDTSNFSSKPRKFSNKKRTILSIGYLVDRKRMIDIIEAFHIVINAKKIQNIELQIIGDGPQSQVLQQQVKKYKLEKYIKLVGYIPKDQVHTYYNKADIFVSASIAESMPGVYFEAMSAALPVIVVENDTVSQLQRVGFGGIVVPAKKPEKIAAAIIDLLTNKARYEYCSGKNRELMQTTFNFQENIHKLKDMFKTTTVKKPVKIQRKTTSITAASVVLLTVLFAALILLLSVRGIPGNPTYQELLSPYWRENGPFELSPERGRFSLTSSIVENKSVFFAPELAKFSMPDVGYRVGKYVSLFAPALSFLVIPGYILGKLMGSIQLGTFLNVSAFALLNFLLMYRLNKKLHMGTLASLLGALVFLFGTPAFSYATSLYQHHATVAVILTALHLFLYSKSVVSSFAIIFLWALAVTLDYPNAFLLAPIGLAMTSRLIEVQKDKQNPSMKVHGKQLFALMGAIIPMLFFFWFNNASYGGPLKMLGGSSLVTVHDIGANGEPIVAPGKSEEIIKQPSELTSSPTSGLTYFKTRNLLNGLTIHLFSPDRGLLYFAPIIVLGILGAFILYQKKPTFTVLLASISLANLLLYSMWGDPWGGWAFGSRYLIPTYAIASIFIASLVDSYRRSLPVLVVFIVFAWYSIYINTAGALSSSANPPKVQVLALEQMSGRVERYSWDRNVEYLQNGHSKSFVYQLWLKDRISAWQYFMTLNLSISAVILILVIGLYVNKRSVRETK